MKTWKNLSQPPNWFKGLTNLSTSFYGTTTEITRAGDQPVQNQPMLFCVGLIDWLYLFLFYVLVKSLYDTAITAIQNDMPIQRLISEKITNRLGDSLV